MRRGGRAGLLFLVVSTLATGCTSSPRTTPSPTLPPTAGGVVDTARPSPAPTSVPTPEATLHTRENASPQEEETVTFTIVYDNYEHHPALHTAWGFACLVQRGDSTVLFDTGGDGPTLLGNMAALGLDPQAIDVVVLSHVHDDHTGGLDGLLDRGGRPVVYVPDAFPDAFLERVGVRTELVEVSGPREILPGFHTTGPVGSRIVEQALVVETAEGRVLITGCAHPGIGEMVRRAQELSDAPLVLAMGGFHLKDTQGDRLEGIVAELRTLGVQNVAPCHCTGDPARQQFGTVFGERFIPVGAGWTYSIPSH